METLSYLTDVNGPRLTNSPNMHAAAAWAQQQLEGYGLANVALEAWGPFGRGWVNEHTSIDDDRAAAVRPARLPEGVDAGHRRRSAARPSLAIIEKAEDFEQVEGQAARASSCCMSPTRDVAVLLRVADAPLRREGPRRAVEASRSTARARPLRPGRARLPGAASRRLPQAAHGVLHQGRRAGAGRDVAGRSRRQRRRDRAGARCPAKPAADDGRAGAVPQVVVAGEHYGRLLRAARQEGAGGARDRRQEPLRRHRAQLATT